jgi:hypothetical protein
MNDNVEKLKNLQDEKEQLKMRKEEIKRKIAEHRDSITDAEIAQSTTEANEIKTREAQIDVEITEVSNIIKKEEERSINIMPETVEKRRHNGIS